MASEGQVTHDSKKSALHILSSTIGVLVGFFGVEHGIFEVLQGNTPTPGIIIDAISPDFEFWPGATEPAFTIVPNFLITGILAIVFGLIVMVWSVVFIERERGPEILWLLMMVLLLVGGGSPPLFVGTLGCVAGTRAGTSLSWWRSKLSDNTQKTLARTWPWTLILYIVLSLALVVIAVFGYPLAYFFDFNTMFFILMLIGNISLVFLIIAIVSAIANDLQRD